MGLLASIADTYDPILNLSEAYDMISTKGDVFQSVWTTAAEWRRNGKLLELGQHIQCPVVAFHGDYDPHPAAGVRKPLSAILKDFRFVLLKNCGHRPWFEKQAQGGFYEAIMRELA
jgi:pimeloyl-ACP methyl ester carboxylesterase